MDFCRAPNSKALETIVSQMILEGCFFPNELRFITNPFRKIISSNFLAFVKEIAMMTDV